MISAGARYVLARTGETVQLIRPVRDHRPDAWLVSVVYPYSDQRDLISCACEWLAPAEQS